jgi:hypothetical protein
MHFKVNELHSQLLSHIIKLGKLISVFTYLSDLWQLTLNALDGLLILKEELEVADEQTSAHFSLSKTKHVIIEKEKDLVEIREENVVLLRINQALKL